MAASVPRRLKPPQTLASECPQDRGKSTHHGAHRAQRFQELTRRLRLRCGADGSHSTPSQQRLVSQQRIFQWRAFVRERAAALEKAQDPLCHGSAPSRRRTAAGLSRHSRDVVAQMNVTHRQVARKGGARSSLAQTPRRNDRWRQGTQARGEARASEKAPGLEVAPPHGVQAHNLLDFGSPTRCRISLSWLCRCIIELERASKGAEFSCGADVD